MGYSIFFEAMLEIALSLFPLFKGSSKRDADVKRSQNDPEEIYLVQFLGESGRSRADTYNWDKCQTWRSCTERTSGIWGLFQQVTMG